MQLSICIITKNQCEKLKRCLNSLKGLDCEIIVTDTGSTDNSTVMALEYTDQVFTKPWEDDFAKAKNYAVSLASNDWVLVLDSDEYLEPMQPDDLARLEALIQENPKSVGRIYRVNLLAKDGQPTKNFEWIHRLFPKQYYHYEGKVHEQLHLIADNTTPTDNLDCSKQLTEDTTHAKHMTEDLAPASHLRRDENLQQNSLDYDTFETPIRILHDGYLGTPDELKKKAERNILLLSKMLEEKEDPYLLYQLGKSYYLAKDFPKAVDYFDKALYYDLNPKLEYVIDLVETYGYALMNANQAEKALCLEGVYEEFSDSADFQFLMGLVYMQNARFDDAIAEFKKAASKTAARMEGVNGFLAYYNIGVIYECLGDHAHAKEYYQLSGAYAPAQAGLARVS